MYFFLNKRGGGGSTNYFSQCARKYYSTPTLPSPLPLPLAQGEGARLHFSSKKVKSTCLGARGGGTSPLDPPLPHLLGHIKHLNWLILISITPLSDWFVKFGVQFNTLEGNMNDSIQFSLGFYF